MLLQSLPGPVQAEIPGNCPVCNAAPYRAGGTIVLFSCGMLFVRESEGVFDPYTLTTSPRFAWVAIYACRNAIDIAMGLRTVIVREVTPTPPAYRGHPSAEELAQADKEVREEIKAKPLLPEVKAEPLISTNGHRPTRRTKATQAHRQGPKPRAVAKVKPRAYHKDTTKPYWQRKLQRKG